MNNLAEYTTAKDLWKVTDFVKRYGKPYDSQNDNYKKDPFGSDVRAGKNTQIYNAHSYHTKVPPEGIEPFIKHYTDSGNLILDPFCGSGMTGIAAMKLSRIPILIDLSPAATFIARNYCASVDFHQFSKEAQRVISQVKELTDWLYEAKCRKCGGGAAIQHVVWSDEFQCPRCNENFLLWNVAIDKEGKVKRVFHCPHCGKELRKSHCRRLSSKPVRVKYYCLKCKRQEANIAGTDFEFLRITEIERRWNAIFQERSGPDTDDSFWPLTRDGRQLWYPTDRMPEGDESRRNDKIGMTHINHYYTVRNLWILAKMWHEINETRDEDIRDKLRWVFTAILEGTSRLNRERASGLPSKLSGTLYVSSFYREIVPTSFFERKVKKARHVFVKPERETIVSIQSATELFNIPSNTVDYVFTDPPFGANLLYSQLNFLWEAWLRAFTSTKKEAIIDETQGKGVKEYKGLMTKSFKEIYRVLKPGRWMTMVFHNSKGEVWQAIQEGLAEAGFAIGMIGIFDKKQKSFKQVTSSGAVGYDVMVNCYKPKATVKNGIQGKTTEKAIIGFIADKLRELPAMPCDERKDRMLHSKTIGFFMQQNKPLKRLSHKDFQEILKNNFREIDGHWYLPYQRPRIVGQKRLFGYISNEAEAIEWLEVFLRKPHKYGDIVPDFFKALGPNKLKKDLQQFLEESFIEENELWRTPTTAEKDRLIKIVSNKTARQIDQYLKGTMDYPPTSTELCEWIEFCYNNGLYQEGSKLFRYVNENTVDPDLFKKTKKIAEICKIKSWG